MLVQPDMMVMSQTMEQIRGRNVSVDLFERLSGADPRLFDPQSGTIRSFEDISYLNLLSRDTTVSELKATQDIFASLPDAERKRSTAKFR